MEIEEEDVEAVTQIDPKLVNTFADMFLEDQKGNVHLRPKGHKQVTNINENIPRCDEIEEDPVEAKKINLKKVNELGE